MFSSLFVASAQTYLERHEACGSAIILKSNKILKSHQGLQKNFSEDNEHRQTFIVLRWRHNNTSGHLSAVWCIYI